MKKIIESDAQANEEQVHQAKKQEMIPMENDFQIKKTNKLVEKIVSFLNLASITNL